MRFRHRLTSALTALALALAGCADPTAAPSPEAPPADPRSATVSELAGAVAGRANAAEALAQVAVGFRLQTSGEVQTGPASKARLDLNDGTLVRLGANTAFVLQDVAAADADRLTVKLQLTLGKIWVSLTGGELQVETPLGIASVRGSFAVFQYAPGDPATLEDDVLVVDCIEGSCAARNAVVDEQLGNLERVVLGARVSLRQILTAADVQSFLQESPESGRVIATLTAAPPATLTPTATTVATTTAPAEAAAAATTAPSATSPAPALALTATVTPLPLIGAHTVRAGEAVFCIARVYGVRPDAIGAANGLDGALTVFAGQTLGIPAAPWTGIAPGPVCAPQFQSPYPGLPFATASPTATPTATPTSTDAKSGVSTPTLTTTVTAPGPTRTFTLTPIPPTVTETPDQQGPVITNPFTSPAIIDPPKSCRIVVGVDITDPAGVTSALVNWTLTNPVSETVSGAVDLVYSEGTTWMAAWTVSFKPASPAYGTLTWSVTANDGLRNATVYTGADPVPVLAAGEGCP